MARIDNLTNYLTDIATAIKTKKGSTDNINAKDFDTEIANLPSGGGKQEEPPLKDIIFYDYDGTILYSYSNEDFLKLTEMPSLPKDGTMIYDEWNYTLENAQMYARNYKACDISAICHTADNKVKIYITLQPARLSPTLSLFVLGTVKINWGDGTSSSMTGTSINANRKSEIHTYPHQGSYIIEIETSSDNRIGFGGVGTGSYIFNSSGLYLSAITKIELSSYVNFDMYSFCNCSNMVSINVPKGCTTVSTGMFYNAYSLKHIGMPSTFTSLGTNFLYNCYSIKSVSFPLKTSRPFTYYCHSLRRIILPEGAMQINCSYCYSAQIIIFPKSLLSISSSAFYYCKYVKLYDFRNSTSVPSLGSYAFNATADDKVILVPDNLYDTWIASNNWSSVANYIKKVSEWEET